MDIAIIRAPLAVSILPEKARAIKKESNPYSMKWGIKSGIPEGNADAGKEERRKIRV